MSETIEGTKQKKDWLESKKSLLAPLTGLGQVMFQDSALTGIFFLAGIAVASPVMALGALAGSIIGTLTAYLFRFNRQEIDDGIYGFNSALVGIAMLFRCEPRPATYMLLIAGSVIAALLTKAMRSRVPFPTYTAPFIVTTWMAFFMAQELNVPMVKIPAATTPAKFDFITALVEGISEVMFQANVLTGVLFLVGILLCSSKGAGWAIVGSLIGLLTGIFEHAQDSALGIGIYGYNGALAAMGMALYRPSIVLPIVAAALSVPITDRIPLLGLATLTAPFVIACWISIGLDRLDVWVYGKHDRLPK